MAKQNPREMFLEHMESVPAISITYFSVHCSVHFSKFELHPIHLSIPNATFQRLAYQGRDWEVNRVNEWWWFY